MFCTLVLYSASVVGLTEHIIPPQRQAVIRWWQCHYCLSSCVGHYIDIAKLVDDLFFINLQ
jgi:hypothetical protein